MESLTSSAQSGYGPAQLALGKIYRDGLGLKADDIEAYKWLKLAQLQGVPEADKELTNCATAMTTEQINAAEDEVKQFQTPR
jgi:TPR repeat protein